MMKTEILQLLDSKQVWELSDKDLSSVKDELLRMASKCEVEQALRNMCDNSDTPLSEMYGGWLPVFFYTNSLHTLTNMNRQELQKELINNVIDGMDFKTMWSVLYDYMDESYDKYTDEELMEEVKEYYPELLEE